MSRKKKFTLAKLEDEPKESKDDVFLREFKAKIADLSPLPDDHSLRKWLKARNNDVLKTEAMYRASMAYRQKMEIDKIVTDYTPPEVLSKYLTGGTIGHDKDGSPIRVELYGNLDMKGLMYSAKKDDMERVKILQCEEHVKDWEIMSEKLNKRVDGLTVIFDMDGVSSKMIWRPGLQMYLHLVKVLEDNYPEMLKRLFVVNAPRIFPIIYKICRPMVSVDTRDKIHVLGANFSSTLLQYIDAEELPAYLGGTKTDPDGNPRCRTMICQGGVVPEEYYLNDAHNSDHMEVVTVARGGKHTLQVEVDKPDSVLRYEFKTENYDINFSVLGVTGEAVIDTERVNSHMVPHDGSLACTQTGTYTVVFDNSFSWARAKTVHFAVEVLPPVDDCTASEVQGMLGDGMSLESLALNADTFNTRL